MFCRALALAIQNDLGKQKCFWTNTIFFLFLLEDYKYIMSKAQKSYSKEIYLSFVKPVIPLFIGRKLSMQNTHTYSVEVVPDGSMLRRALTRCCGSCQGNIGMVITYSLPPGMWSCVVNKAQVYGMI